MDEAYRLVALNDGKGHGVGLGTEPGIDIGASHFGRNRYDWDSRNGDTDPLCLSRLGRRLSAGHRRTTPPISHAEGIHQPINLLLITRFSKLPSSLLQSCDTNLSAPIFRAGQNSKGVILWQPQRWPFGRHRPRPAAWRSDRPKPGLPSAPPIWR